MLIDSVISTLANSFSGPYVYAFNPVTWQTGAHNFTAMISKRGSGAWLSQQAVPPESIPASHPN